MSFLLEGSPLQEDGTSDGWGRKFERLPEGLSLTVAAIRKLVPEIHARKVILAGQITQRHERELESSGWDWTNLPVITDVTRTTHIDDPHTNSATIMYCKNLREGAERSTYFSRLPLTIYAYLSIKDELNSLLKEKDKATALEACEALQESANAGQFCHPNGEPLETVTRNLAILWRLVFNVGNQALIQRLQEATMSSKQVWTPGSLALVSCHTAHHAGEGATDDADLYYAKIAA